MFSIVNVVRLKLVHDYYISSTRVRLNRDTEVENRKTLPRHDRMFPTCRQQKKVDPTARDGT